MTPHSGDYSVTYRTIRHYQWYFMPVNDWLPLMRAWPFWRTCTDYRAFTDCAGDARQTCYRLIVLVVVDLDHCFHSYCCYHYSPRCSVADSAVSLPALLLVVLPVTIPLPVWWPDWPDTGISYSIMPSNLVTNQPNSDKPILFCRTRRPDADLLLLAQLLLLTLFAPACHYSIIPLQCRYLFPFHQMW